MTTVKEAWEMECPKCKNDEKIEIQAKVWVRLIPDGTDPDEAEEYSGHDWENKSLAKCQACKHTGTVKEFQVED